MKKLRRSILILLSISYLIYIIYEIWPLKDLARKDMGYVLDWFLFREDIAVITKLYLFIMVSIACFPKVISNILFCIEYLGYIVWDYFHHSLLNKTGTGLLWWSKSFESSKDLIFLTILFISVIIFNSSSKQSTYRQQGSYRVRNTDRMRNPDYTQIDSKKKSNYNEYDDYH